MMRSLVFGIPLCFLFACQTEAESKGIQKMHSMAGPGIAKTAEPKEEILLQKIVGRLPEEAGKSQIFDCKISSKQVSDPAKIKALIEQVNKNGLSQAYLFRAADPSVEIYGFLGDKKVLIYEYASVLRYPKPMAGSEHKNAGDHELISLTHSICPTPSPNP